MNVCFTALIYSLQEETMTRVRENISTSNFLINKSIVIYKLLVIDFVRRTKFPKEALSTKAMISGLWTAVTLGVIVRGGESLQTLLRSILATMAWVRDD